MTTVGKWTKVIIPVVFTCFFLYLAARGIQLDDFRESIRKTSWLLVAVASAMALMSIYIRALRWKILLNPVKAISYGRVLSKTMIGFMANNILPAHAGDVVRGVILGKQEDVPVAAALTTVIVERLFDGIALAGIMIVILFLIDLPQSLQSAGIIISGISLFLLVFLFLLAYSESIRDWVENRIAALKPKWRERILPQFKALVDGLGVFHQPGQLLMIAALSLVVWAHMSLTIYLILVMFPVAGSQGVALILASTTLLVFLAFAVALPSTPGYVGVTQAVFVFTLGIFSIPESDALTCSILFNATQYIPVTIAGFYYLFREGLGLKALVVAQKAKDISPN